MSSLAGRDTPACPHMIQDSFTPNPTALWGPSTAPVLRVNRSDQQSSAFLECMFYSRGIANKQDESVERGVSDGEIWDGDGVQRRSYEEGRGVGRAGRSFGGDSLAGC